ncbi:MAG TPA: DUF692 domain-containing protein [Candidatus Nitrosotenuis sp.]|nr:DUF692 domain-containing protein [Candidatus Nitrosotenuis sp.]
MQIKCSSHKKEEGFTSLSGLGLRHPHVDEVLATNPSVGWFEVHSENYMLDYGPRKEKLLAIRQDYPISLHGVCLSLGSADGLDLNHLKLLKELIQEIDPCLVSDHLSWGRYHQVYLQDLLPIPYTPESLNVFCQNLNKAQEFLGRRLLIENPSSYLLFPESTLEEPIFLKEIVKKSGCQVLLDINNIYVACHNHRWNPYHYIETFSSEDVGEIHLAGHSLSQENSALLIDTHSTYVCDEVWELYRYALRHLGAKPTLIEWDADLPDFAELQKEANKVSLIIEEEIQYDHQSQPKTASV